MKIFRSIRWWLPLSYMGIAILATATLSSVLIVTLHDYYAQREYEYLERNAEGIQRRIQFLNVDTLSAEIIESEINRYAVLSRTQIEVLDPSYRTILISSDSQDMLFAGVTLANGRDNRNTPNASEAFLPIPLSDTPPITSNISIEIDDTSIIPPTPPDRNHQFNEPSPLYTGDILHIRSTSFGYQITIENPPEETVSNQEITLPLYDRDNTLVGYIKLSEGPAFGTEIVNDVSNKLAMASVVAVFMAMIAGWFTSRNIYRPVLSLSDVTQQMTDGNLSARAKLSRHDEFGSLAKSFNAMAQRIQDTIATLQRFIADAAHEINTPITALQTNLELAYSEIEPRQCQNYLQHAQTQLFRLKTLTNNLLDLTRIESQTTELSKVNLTALIHQSIETVASRAEQAGLTIESAISTPQPLYVYGNEQQLSRVLNNLLDNAVKFTPENGLITVGLDTQQEEVNLYVKDSGIGIPEDDLSGLFGRFHRGRNAASYAGNGLGLAIAKTIIDKHQGRILVQSTPNGTCFEVHLPMKASHGHTN